MINIHTFTTIYDELEDRIRLIINYREYESRVDFHLTRSFIIRFLPTIDEYIGNNFTNNTPTTKSPPAESENMARFLSSSNSPTDPAMLNLMQKDPILLTRVDLNLSADKQMVRMTLTAKDETQAVATLNKELLEGFLKNLHTAIPNLKWGIGNLI